MPMRLKVPLAALLALAPTSACLAQGLPTPDSHWGAATLPDLGERKDVGVHFVLFTQYGKETRNGQYTFDRYNDIDQTLGFNILSFSESGPLKSNLDRGTLDAGGKTWQRRRTYSVGPMSDVITQFLQNRVAHQGRANNPHLLPVPRDTTDNPSHITQLPTKLWPFVAGMSDEYFLILNRSEQAGDRVRTTPTPFFVGGGWSAGTVNQELFAHVGMSSAELRLRHWDRIASAVTLDALGIGGMARLGVLIPGPILRDLTADYANAQALIHVRGTVAGFFVQVEYGYTATTGFFATKRDAAFSAIQQQADSTRPPASLYYAKTAAQERFSTIRVRIGDFTVEHYNDSAGGKDKGPTFGANISWDAYDSCRNPGWCQALFPWFR